MRREVPARAERRERVGQLVEQEPRVLEVRRAARGSGRPRASRAPPPCGCRPRGARPGCRARAASRRASRAGPRTRTRRRPRRRRRSPRRSAPGCGPCAGSRSRARAPRAGTGTGTSSRRRPLRALPVAGHVRWRARSANARSSRMTETATRPSPCLPRSVTSKPGATGRESPGVSMNTTPATSAETAPSSPTSVITEADSASRRCSTPSATTRWKPRRPRLGHVDDGREGRSLRERLALPGALRTPDAAAGGELERAQDLAEVGMPLGQPYLRARVLVVQPQDGVVGGRRVLLEHAADHGMHDAQVVDHHHVACPRSEADGPVLQHAGGPLRTGTRLSWPASRARSRGSA